MALLHVLQLANAKVINTSTHQILYTVPAGDRVVLRSITMQNLASVAQGCIIYLPDPAQILFHSLGAKNSGTDTFEWRPWIVLGPGQSIGATVGNTTGVNVVLSGSLYTI